MSQRPGTAFEEEIQERFDFSKTTNSGAVHGDGDLRHDGGRFIVECKDDRRHEGMSIPSGDFLKMKQQAALFGDSNWVRFVRRKNGEISVTMNVQLFETMLSVCDGKIVCPECKTRLKPDW